MLPTFALTLDPLDPSIHAEEFCFVWIILDSNLEARATIVLQSSFSVPLTMVLPGLLGKLSGKRFRVICCCDGTIPGSTEVIDIWSAACVSAELILGHPMFPGESGVDQLATT